LSALLAFICLLFICRLALVRRPQPDVGAVALLALVALATLSPSRARASEPELFGMGARGGAMAGTGVADAEGYEATYTNPAGLVGPTRRRLTLGYVHAGYGLSLDGTHHPVDATDGLLLGAALPLPFGGALRDRVGLGLGFYFPFGVINRARAPYPDQPRLALLDTRTQVVSVLVAGAARVHARVTVGVGVLALAALVGNIAITPDAGGRVVTVSEEQLTASYTPIVGVRVQAAPWARVGAVFRGESKSTYDITVTNNLGSLIPLTLPTLRIAGTAQFDPLQIAVETALRLRRWLTIDVGVTWKHWSAFDLPTQNATLGAPPQPSPGFHDTAVPRLAGEATARWTHWRLHGRAGYFFEWSPARGPVLLDADRHVLTAGVGVEWLGRATSLQLDGFGQWHHLQPNGRVAGDVGVLGLTLGVDL
jgi:long-chain fatty acid transport protein